MTVTLSVTGGVMWSFLRGFADSLRGAFDLFLLDSKAVKQKERQSVQREVAKEILLNRDSPAREIESFAKRRALERRRRETSRGPQERGAEQRGSTSEPRILERTLKCCALNGCVFWLSIVIFESVLLPFIQTVFYASSGGPEVAEKLWTWTGPMLSVTFSTLWVMPFYLISKIVNALWFQDIADSAFRTSRGRPQMMSSISVMIADTIFSLVVEAIFLIQGRICSFLPIEILGVAANLVHLCLLHSLYCFEYKWFNQGIELHRRLTLIERDWPYFLGFGLPLALLTSMPSSLVVSGCVFSILFPLFIVSGNQAQVASIADDISLHIFHPTIVISNAIFSRTFKKKKSSPVTNPDLRIRVQRNSFEQEQNRRMPHAQSL